MRRITELSANEAKFFLLQEESYANFDLPHYFSFQRILNLYDKELDGKKLKEIRSHNPRKYDDINYRLLNNKDGKYAWRPFQLIHPAIYVSLVHELTEDSNWREIQQRFSTFFANDKIECHSIPMKSHSEGQTDKESQIYTWWQLIEQRSISLALDFRYILLTDIADCYGSIYTHSISWAMHGKEEAKKRKNRNNFSLLGVVIDNHLQDMSFGQTNGIPQGSILMDFIAEIVLGYVDLKLSDIISELEIEDYRILRYRDDYRIFTNNPFEADQITKALSEILSEMGLKLNPDKTKSSDDVIKNAIKPDKRYWISNKRITENKQKWLIQLYMLSEEFPNSGTLDMQMRMFLEILGKSKRKDPNVQSLISLVVEIAFRNPRVNSVAITILTLLINQIENEEEKQNTIKRIKNKFLQIPNSSLLEVWLQRLFIKLEYSIEYTELICNKVLQPEVEIWNTEWLSRNLKNILKQVSIVDNVAIEKLQEIALEDEIKLITSKKTYEG